MADVNLHLSITTDRDWLRLNLYRMALERIRELSEEEPWSVPAEVDEVARIALETFAEEPDK